MEAKTAGKYGFGFPKTFVFKSMDPSVSGEYILRYRDNTVDSPLHDPQRQNFELVMAAITQFCESRTNLTKVTTEELNPVGTLFAGDVKNRYGRIVSGTSFLPRHRAHLPI